MKYYYNYKTLIGPITIVASDDFLENIVFGTTKTGEEKQTPIILNTITQLNEYFAGERYHFDLPINLKGTEFQKKVWEGLLQIKYGETISYQDLAEKIGNKKASRAVGLANNKNKVPIVIPCHRVIGKNGKLVGYAGGIDIKIKLLELEINLKKDITL